MSKRIAVIWVSLALILSFIVIIIEIAPIVEAPTIIYVDDVPGVGPGNPDENYTSIQDAINASNYGDTVYVYSGTYYENILVNKTLHLIGEDRDITIINGSENGDVIRITANLTNVSGLTLTGSGKNWGEAGIKLDNVQNCSVFNNNASSNNYYGIFILYSNSNNISNNFISFNKKDAFRLFNANRNNIMNNVVTNNEDAGISLMSSDENNIINNNASSNKFMGIYIGDSFGNNIINNKASYNMIGIYLDLSNWNNIIDNNVSLNSNHGFLISHSNWNTVSTNIASNNYIGIGLSYSIGNNLISNTMNGNGIYIDGNQLIHWNTHNIDTSNTINSKPAHYWKNQSGGTIPQGAGQVILANCTNINIKNQKLTSGSVGIELGYSSNNSIKGNNASSNNRYGIYLYYSNGNNIYGNEASLNRGKGIMTYSSNDNNIKNNNVSLNKINGIELQSSDKNNLTDNRVFLNNITGIILYGSHNNGILYNMVTSNKEAGIDLHKSSYNNIKGNYVTNNDEGIYLVLDSEYNNINNNHVWFNDKTGVVLENSALNNINGNNISSNNVTGISLRNDSSGNSIVENFISNNLYGIDFYWSSNTNIYHNNFINNTNQVFEPSPNGNKWNDNYPSGGNYWSDYIGNDSFNGPNQDIPGSDGIGDTNYSIDSNSIDNYPLMEPYPILFPPRIRLLSPANNSITQENMIFDFHVYDDNLCSVNYSINEGINISLSDPYDISTMGWADGGYTIQINALDLAENSISSWYFFIIDSTKPIILLIAPYNNSTVPPGAPLDLTVIDLNLMQVNYSINKGMEVSLTDPFNISTIGWVDGNYLIRVNALDLSGNLNSSEFFITIDSSLPNIILNGPNNNSIIQGGTILDFSITDLNLYSANFSINEGADISFLDPFDISTNGWVDGAYTVKIKALDQAGNSNSSWFLFTLDSTPPQISIDPNLNHSTIPMGRLIEINIMGLDTNSVMYSIDESEYFVLETPYILNTSTWEDGTHIIKIKANDTICNEAIFWFVITVDTIFPYIVSTTPLNKSVDIDINVTVIIAFSEAMNIMNIENHVFIFPSSNFILHWDATGTKLFISFEENNLIEGTTYNLTIDSQITDIHGNSMGSDFVLIFTTSYPPLDTDGDSIPDIEDYDDDNDGYLDENDAFPLDSAEWLDTDGDKIGNNADPDDDNDGHYDEEDIDPLDPNVWKEAEEKRETDTIWIWILTLVIIVVCIIVLLFILRKRGWQPEENLGPEEDYVTFEEIVDDKAEFVEEPLIFPPPPPPPPPQDEKRLPPPPPPPLPPP